VNPTADWHRPLPRRRMGLTAKVLFRQKYGRRNQVHENFWPWRRSVPFNHCSTEFHPCPRGRCLRTHYDQGLPFIPPATGCKTVSHVAHDRIIRRHCSSLPESLRGKRRGRRAGVGFFWPVGVPPRISAASGLAKLLRVTGPRSGFAATRSVLKCGGRAGAATPLSGGG
jgi:hypothetical protein